MTYISWVPCSLAVVVESCHITICYTIGVYMVHHFLDKSADESQIGTLTGLLVSVLFLCSKRSCLTALHCLQKHLCFYQCQVSWWRTAIPCMHKWQVLYNCNRSSYRCSCAVVLLFFGAAHNCLCLGAGQRQIWPQAAHRYVKPLQHHIHADVWPGWQLCDGSPVTCHRRLVRLTLVLGNVNSVRCHSGPASAEDFAAARFLHVTFDEHYAGSIAASPM